MITLNCHFATKLARDFINLLVELKLEIKSRLKMLRYYGICGHFVYGFQSVWCHPGKNGIIWPKKEDEKRGVSPVFFDKLDVQIKKYGNSGKIQTHLFEHPPAIMFISNFMPRYDKTAADFRLYNILQILLANHCKIDYLYFGETRDDARYKKIFDGDINFNLMPLDHQEISKSIQKKKHLNLWITNLWRIDYVRSMAQLTTELRNRDLSFKIIIDTMDFHFNGFFRKYELTHDTEDINLANQFLELEKAIYKSADIVVVVSEEESRNIQEKITGIKRFEIVPVIHQISNFIRPFNKRRNMCFVGHFGNQHNVDAVRYFIENIFQLILKRNPGIEFHIIGHSSEKYKKEFESQYIKVIGSLKHLQKALSYYKLFVCPMTSGTGMKGKIASAIAAGVPVVTTTLGAEGFPVTDGKDCFISDSPEEFAEKCNQCLNDSDLWRNFSANSRIMLANKFSPSAISCRIRQIFNC